MKESKINHLCPLNLETLKVFNLFKEVRESFNNNGWSNVFYINSPAYSEFVYEFHFTFEFGKLEVVHIFIADVIRFKFMG